MYFRLFASIKSTLRRLAHLDLKSERADRCATDLSEFGMVAFETRAKPKGRRGGDDVEYAMLNEPQASLLILMMRNAPRAVEFKVALIRDSSGCATSYS